MKQTARIISTYSADVFGVCSALFELGGMVIMHDASGCNSTYTTHDEPRWYDMESMVYISGLSEMEAIMGDDEKLISDIVAAAEDLKPKFIAVAGTPIPTMTGFDFEAVAALIEERTGIPAFGFSTTGMNTYVSGACMALEAIARRFTAKAVSKTAPLSANILGLTPLDFTVNGSDDSIVRFLEDSGYQVISRWAMGSTLEELAQAGSAHVNLVVSASGLGAAKALKESHPEKEILVFLHFPPLWGDFICAEFLDTIQSFGVKRCFFGHIHGSYNAPPKQIYGDLSLHLISSDYLNFIPFRIHQIAEHFEISVIRKTNLANSSTGLFFFNPFFNSKIFQAIPCVRICQHMHQIIIYIIRSKTTQFLCKKLVQSFPVSNHIMRQFGSNIHALTQIMLLKNRM